MGDGYVSISDMRAIAERKAKEVEDIERRNARRRKKGLKPLPMPWEREELDVARTRHRTNYPVAVSSEEALKLFTVRREQMSAVSDQDDGTDEIEEEEEEVEVKKRTPKKAKATPEPGLSDEQAAEKAVREAESVRRVEDMKAGRINHETVWSDDGQRLEGGDNPPPPENPPEMHLTDKERNVVAEMLNNGTTAPLGDVILAFKDDLYDRLRQSFSAIETTLSDIQGRIAEIVKASVQPPAVEQGHGGDEFRELLDRRTPVVFDVGGTKMSFDAVTVFHASPCITVVSKSGSATIMPKPGARLNLTYTMDGVQYTNDPVTFLGTRFELPMFGLSFVGFIRDTEADRLDADAGVQEA